jgi:uncharacterized membrane protein
MIAFHFTGAGPVQHMSEKQNIANWERIASVVGGTLAAGYGLSRRSWTGGALALAGIAFIERGLSGRCRLKAALEGSGPVQFHRTLTITSKTPEEVYALWRNFDMLPQWMESLHSVDTLDERRSHWVARGLAGKRVEWDAEITNERPGRLIEWRSLPGSGMDISGIVRFRRKQGGGTKVHLTINYSTPGGIVGETLAHWFGQNPETKIDAGLAGFREALESA